MTSWLNYFGWHRRDSVRSNRIPIATLIMLGLIILTGGLVAVWFSGNGTLYHLFAELQAMQNHPPMWLQVPMVMGEYLLTPTVTLLAISLLIMRVSPIPRTWSRAVVVGILLMLVIRYLLWRSLTTLNVSDPLNGVFSIGLFILEIFLLLTNIIQLFLMLRVKDRSLEANRLAIDVIEGRFTPSVDILIPTYNEPAYILKRTIVGCQALEYVNKKIYLLDDTRREEIRQLADELKCEYIARLNNHHAKAGNLNNALTHTQGELIVVFDADFIPTKNFLLRTLGFFQDPTVALVQTPQSYYNADPIARNLGLDNIITPEEEVFYRQIEPIKDGAGSVVCSGTSFVVRRSALEDAGGFVTESLSEDYFTGIKLSARGYRLVYLNEKLSAGLAAENIAAYATQRLRWARGTLQAFFIDSNPLTIRGLKPIQRLAHLEGLLHWFTCIPRVVFLLMPLAYSGLGVIPIRASFQEMLYFFLPYYLVQLTVFSWLNYRSRSALLSDIYSLVLAFPLVLTVFQVMLSPFSKGFNVTAKGTASDHFSFNWKLALPLVLLFIPNAINLWHILGTCLIQVQMHASEPAIIQHFKGLGIGWIWSAYNLLIMSITLLILLDAPKCDRYEWFDLRRLVRLTANGQIFWGVTTFISEVGVHIEMTQGELPVIIPGEVLPVTLKILEDNLRLQGQITQMDLSGEFPSVQIHFDKLELAQHRCLVEMLFCRPGQWKRPCAPGELKSLFLLFGILLKPRILFDRDRAIDFVKVSKG
ncbi:MAG: glycosyltransferase [Microcoleus sp. CSU_2_2]|nr:glycosyltransferase [Microcoleus sp. SU_5_3]NJS12417.1 glycosyltransferase [Microcoleus sp. CSU_2_2]